MSLLISDLKSYATQYPKKHIKNKFFNELADKIQKNELTLHSLTHKLTRLTSKQRQALFATTYGFTSPINGDAAALIKRVYFKELGVKLNDAMFDALVNAEPPLSAPQEKRLLRARYDQWRKARFNEEKQRALEHELKWALIRQKDKEQALEKSDSLHKKSLPFFLLNRWQRNHFATLGQDLETLIAQAPHYGPQLLERIFSASNKQKLDTDFIRSLFNSIEKDRSFAILSTLCKSHPVLVAHWIMEQPAYYFQLSNSMQVDVLRLLEKAAANKDLPYSNKAQRSLQHIAVDAQNEHEIDISDVKDALLDGSVRQNDTKAQTQKLQKNLIALVWKKAHELIQHDQIDDAQRIIEEYLRQQPNQYKHDFFKKLAKDIQNNGLTIELLERHLQEKTVDKGSLFAKWTGRVNSKAAEVMDSLYERASLGKKLSYSQMNAMVNTGELPIELIDYSPLITAKVKEVLESPAQQNASHFTQYVGDVFIKMQAKAQFLVDEHHKKQRIAEAIYQQYLIQQGLIVANLSTKPVFDPQGHVMLFLILKDGDYQKILSYVLEQTGETKKEGISAEHYVKTLLGAKITNPTLCNLDIKQHPELTKKFIEWVGDERTGEQLMSSAGRSSIIKLQEEMAMHALLCLRVLETKTTEPLEAELRGNLLIEINALVRDEFKAALKRASHHGTLNLVELNRELNLARKRLAPLCRWTLVQLVCESYPDTDWQAQAEELEQHDFTSTTATGLDYLHSDARNQTVVRISGTEQTAHDKTLGKKNQAFRLLYRNQYKPDGTVIPCKTQTTEARVPYIAVKEASSEIGIKDVAAKLREDHSIFKSQTTHSHGPMIYNLLTSLHTAIYDVLPGIELQNRQRLSANYIVQGDHLYNLQQMNAGNSQALVYLQNIPVNQHTNKLDDNAFAEVTGEVTLMTDMALLSTLHHYSGLFSYTVRHDLDATYSFTHKKYLSFLPEIEKGSPYFHETDTGRIVKSILDQRKELWNQVPIENHASDSLNTLAVKALFKMYAKNAHRNPQFGMLAQTLSVFVEPMSMTGCKSANERYQAVSGRVELLKSIDSRPESDLSREESNLKKALKNIINGKGTLAQLQECMDRAYNRHNLQGAAAGISEEDQAAGSKVEATQNKTNPGVISEWDTNVAESWYLNKLFQSECSPMQSHKAHLDTEFRTLFQAQKASAKMQSTL
ncbi:MAG: hypothetical protein ACRCXC_01520 [Legionella sp.]